MTHSHIDSTPKIPPSLMATPTNMSRTDCVVFYLPSIYAKAEVLPTTHPNVITCHLNESLSLHNDNDPQQAPTFVEGDVIIIAGDIVSNHVPCHLGRAHARVIVQQDFGYVHNPHAPCKLYVLIISRSCPLCPCIHIHNSHITFLQDIINKLLPFLP
jgi:hypothetical protein